MSLHLQIYGCVAYDGRAFLIAFHVDVHLIMAAAQRAS